VGLLRVKSGRHENLGRKAQHAEGVIKIDSLARKTKTPESGEKKTRPPREVCGAGGVGRRKEKSKRTKPSTALRENGLELRVTRVKRPLLILTLS